MRRALTRGRERLREVVFWPVFRLCVQSWHDFCTHTHTHTHPRFNDPFPVVRGGALRLDSPAANGAAAQRAGWPAVTPRRGVVLLARRTLAGAVALFLASVAGSAHADGLFLPVAAQDAPAMPATSSGLSAQPRGSDRQGAWERHVRIARHFLDDARDGAQRGEAGRLLLNVRLGTSLDVVVERTARIKRGYTLSGRIEGDAVGFVTLVVHEEAMAASIWTPQMAYELRYLGGGVHALRDVTNAPAVECGGALPYGAVGSKSTTAQGRTDDGSVVDILVAWTPGAEADEERYGDGDPMMSIIDLLIARTNDAFERSGALVSLNLVGAERVDYEDLCRGGFCRGGADLDRLISPDDGHLDQLHDRRDVLGADLVFLLMGGGAGIATHGGPFAVGNQYAFTHEIGHNFGVNHERLDGPTAYAHGFQRRCVRTVMAVGVGCSGGGFWSFFASPWRYSLDDGRPLGVTRFSKERGADGPADAVLTLNRNRHRVANFRPSSNVE